MSSTTRPSSSSSAAAAGANAASLGGCGGNIGVDLDANNAAAATTGGDATIQDTLASADVALKRYLAALKNGGEEYREGQRTVMLMVTASVKKRYNEAGVSDEDFCAVLDSFNSGHSNDGEDHDDGVVAVTTIPPATATATSTTTSTMDTGISSDDVDADEDAVTVRKWMMEDCGWDAEKSAANIALHTPLKQTLARKIRFWKQQPEAERLIDEALREEQQDSAAAAAGGGCARRGGAYRLTATATAASEYYVRTILSSVGLPQDIIQRMVADAGIRHPLQIADLREEDFPRYGVAETDYECRLEWLSSTMARKFIGLYLKTNDDAQK